MVVFKNPLPKKKLLLILLVILVIGFLIKETPVAYEIVDEDTKIAEDRMERLLNCLSFLESGNRPEIIIVDTNSKLSIGLYQFQIDTVKQFSTTTNPKALALDPIASRQLAKEMIEKGKINRWYTSVQKIKNGLCEDLEPDELNNYLN